jgi:hypothetical protein
MHVGSALPIDGVRGFEVVAQPGPHPQFLPRAPSVLGVNVRVPVKAAVAMRLVEANRCGRSKDPAGGCQKAVYSICMPRGRRRVRTVAENRVPTPIGPSVIIAALTMLGL